MAPPGSWREASISRWGLGGAPTGSKLIEVMTTVCGPRACSARQAAAASASEPIGLPVKSSASNWLGVRTEASGTTCGRGEAPAVSGRGG
eukprot:scaffold24665_cov137-Isochrysis_galbana.AAC.1